MNSKQKYMYCNILLKSTIMFDAFVTRREYFTILKHQHVVEKYKWDVKKDLI